MTLQVAIMAAVAAAFTLAGAWLLLELRHPQAPARVYVYRMVGIMALAAGIVLGFSAAALQQWSIES
jgi:hypothetical protein